MKVGQMLSLQDTFLPPEVAAVLRSLQKQAQPDPVRDGPGSSRPRSATPIRSSRLRARGVRRGVHRAGPPRRPARTGGRWRSRSSTPRSTGSSRPTSGTCAASSSRSSRSSPQVDFEPIWRELPRAAARGAGLPPRGREPAPDGRAPRRRAGDRHPGGRRRGHDAARPDDGVRAGPLARRGLLGPLRAGAEGPWGLVLFDFLLRGLLEHRLLHADPNLANFAFRPDGRVVVYDFGCMKEVPVRLARGYAELCFAALEERVDDFPRVLARMGVHRGDGEPLPGELVTPYVESVLEVVRDEPTVPLRRGHPCPPPHLRRRPVEHRRGGGDPVPARHRLRQPDGRRPLREPVAPEGDGAVARARGEVRGDGDGRAAGRTTSFCCDAVAGWGWGVPPFGVGDGKKDRNRDSFEDGVSEKRALRATIKLSGEVALRRASNPGGPRPCSRERPDPEVEIVEGYLEKRCA